MQDSLYNKWRQQVLSECSAVLEAVDPAVVDEYIRLIKSARKVFLIGVGRVLLSLQAIAKRYNHLGIPCVVVGEITEPAITRDDVLIVGSGSGGSIFPKAIAEKAKGMGVTIIHIGSIPQNPLSGVADMFVRLPAKSKQELPGEVASSQPMTSLFEQSLLLFGDITAGMMIEQDGIELHSLWQYHANLE